MDIKYSLSYTSAGSHKVTQAVVHLHAPLLAPLRVFLVLDSSYCSLTSLVMLSNCLGVFSWSSASLILRLVLPRNLLMSNLVHLLTDGTTSRKSGLY